VSVVVVSQPMFLPWLGLFEQLRLADHVVHYDDVQLPLGRSFITRVQIKTAQGARWLTAPVERRAGQRIDEACFTGDDWRRRHLRTLRHAYARAPHAEAMLALAEAIYREPAEGLADFNIAATERLAAELGLSCRFHRSSSFGPERDERGEPLRSTERLLTIVRRLGGTTYVTGHGAKNYLDHERFADRGIEVRYMAYRRQPYRQLHGPFDPHVTVLDTIANLGPHASQPLVSGSQPWREFLAA